MNKLKVLAGITNLYLIETLDSVEKAQKLDRLVSGRILDVYIQVNTSAEGQKSGINPKEAPSLALYISRECPNLKFSGLMTIGCDENSLKIPNPDFTLLVECQHQIAKSLSVEPESLQLSMGMSQDYIQAVLIIIIIIMNFNTYNMFCL